MATCGCSTRMPSAASTAPRAVTSSDRRAARDPRGPSWAGPGGFGQAVALPGSVIANRRSIVAAAAAAAAPGSAGHRRRNSHQATSATAPWPSRRTGDDAETWEEIPSSPTPPGRRGQAVKGPWREGPMWAPKWAMQSDPDKPAMTAKARNDETKAAPCRRVCSTLLRIQVDLSEGGGPGGLREIIFHDMLRAEQRPARSKGHIRA